MTNKSTMLLEHNLKQLKLPTFLREYDKLASQCATLTGVEVQSEKYSTGLPDNLPAHQRPLPFLYESTGAETQFTNRLDPEPRSRLVFSFHAPEALATWLGVSDTVSADPHGVRETRSGYLASHNLRQKLKSMPPLNASGLWPVQERAIRNLEESFAAGRPRALMQMATGSGKTFMACNRVSADQARRC